MTKNAKKAWWRYSWRYLLPIETAANDDGEVMFRGMLEGLREDDPLAFIGLSLDTCALADNPRDPKRVLLALEGGSLGKWDRETQHCYDDLAVPPWLLGRPRRWAC